MNNSRLIIIFIKNPEKGYVKTRLAETLGNDKALEVYKKLTSYTRSVAASVNADKQVWYSRFIPEKDEWDARSVSRKLQQGTDLGERMQYAFREAFQTGYKEVAIIGSDCAQLTAGIIHEAYNMLKDNNFVVGPSEDGGYYLLAMDAFYEELFEGISWSTNQVLAQTLGIAKDLELDVHLLPELNDVDNEKDWQAVKDQL